jgi:hypothetical protein
MKVPAARMIPPIRRPQILGVVAVLAVFILLEFAVGEHDRLSAVLSNDLQGTTAR